MKMSGLRLNPDVGKSRPLPETVSLETVLRDIFQEEQPGTRSDSSALRVARAIYSDTRIRRIARAICYRHRLQEENEELLQRILLIWHQKYFQTMSVAEGVYSLIYSIADHIAKDTVEQSMDSPRFLSLSHDEDVSSDSSAGVEALRTDRADTEDWHWEERQIERVDQSRQAERLLVLIKALPKASGMETPSIVDYPAPLGGTKLNTKKKKANYAEHDELISIRSALKISYDQFAQDLGIPTATLMAYVYRRTLRVPKRVLDKARTIKAERGYVPGAEFYGHLRPMSEIAKGWMVLLGVDEPDELARLLAVAPVTVRRWLNDRIRPKELALLRYEETVSALKTIGVEHATPA